MKIDTLIYKFTALIQELVHSSFLIAENISIFVSLISGRTYIVKTQ